MSRTRLAPHNEHLNEIDPEIVKKGTLASPAMARASNVLPVPEANNRAPFGIPQGAEIFRDLLKFDNFLKLSFCLIDTRDVFECYATLMLS